MIDMNTMGKNIALWATALLLASPLARGEGDGGHSHAAHSHEHAHEEEMPAAEGALAGESLYQLDALWTDHLGREGRLRRFAGHPVVMAMVYTSCEYACPLIVGDMMKIHDSLSAEERGRVWFLLASFDPARDTPAAMKEYRERKLPAQRWTLISADDDDALDMAVALGVRYKPLPDGEFSHSNLVFVLDDEGRPILRQEGLGNSPDEAVAALRALAARG